MVPRLAIAPVISATSTTAFGLANLVGFEVVTHEQAQVGSRVCRGTLARELSGAEIILAVPRHDISVTARSTNSWALDASVTVKLGLLAAHFELAHQQT